MHCPRCQTERPDDDLIVNDWTGDPVACTTCADAYFDELERWDVVED